MMTEVLPPSAAAVESIPASQEETAERKPYFSIVPVEVSSEPLFLPDLTIPFSL
jgi:hypothetical protein